MGKSIVDHIPNFRNVFVAIFEGSTSHFPSIFRRKSKFINLRWEFCIGDLSFVIPHTAVESDFRDSQVFVGKSLQLRSGKIVVQNIPILFLNLLFPPHTKPLVDEFPSMSGYFPRTPF